MKGAFRSFPFWVGMLIRLLTLPLAGSNYLNDLFLPFVDSFVQHPWINPWTLFEPRFFPYGTVLLAILSFPKWLGYQLWGQAALGLTPLSLTLIKLPLLVTDVLFLGLLVRFSEKHGRRVVYFFWLNPVLIYITYCYGQLDLVSMFFCFLSLYCLLRSATARSALAMALAALCKAHVAILAPYLLAYLWNRHFSRQAARQIALWLVLFATVAGFGFLPLWQAGAFLKASANNPEAGRLFAARIDFGGGLSLYLGLSLVLGVLVRLCLASTISTEGLVYGCGMLFGTMLLVTNAAPGWFYWYLPFLALFWANYTTVPLSLFVILQLTFVGYFWAFPQSSLAFTLLQTALAATLVVLWGLGVSGEAPVLGRMRPYLIGIAGDSGAGKSTLTSSLSRLFSEDLTVVLEGDDYHRWERSHHSWNNYTHLDPRANSLSSMVEHVLHLAGGKTVFCPHYDHHSGTFTEPREIRPNRTVIVQGLHTFYVRRLRNSFDLKVFLNPDERVRLAWKVARDVEERNKDLTSVLTSMEERLADSQAHIQPQSEYADWIIRVAPRDGGESLEELEIRYSFWNDAPVESLIDHINESQSCRMVQHPGPHLERVEYVVQGLLTPEEVNRIAHQIFPQMRQLTRSRQPPEFDSGMLGLHQLFVMALMQPKILSRF